MLEHLRTDRLSGRTTLAKSRRGHWRSLSKVDYHEGSEQFDIRPSAKVLELDWADLPRFAFLLHPSGIAVELQAFCARLQSKIPHACRMALAGDASFSFRLSLIFVALMS